MAIHRSRLNPAWVRKWLIFGLIVFAFGSWGLYDAAVIYPKRGEEDVSYRLKEYLAAADRSGQITTVGVTGDPRVALDQLRAQEASLHNSAGDSTASGRAATTELAKLEWLAALARVGRLTPDRTASTNPELSAPRESLKSLQAQWTGKERPKPLNDFDLRLQWLFFGLGYLGAGYFAWLILSRRSKVFTWDDEARRLTFPGGKRSIIPADLIEVDKRQWHKYYVTLGTADGAKTTIDLQSHVPVEDWVLEMERIAFPESQEAQGDADKPAAEARPVDNEPPLSTGPGPQA
jgi:hypothetical protein